MQPGGDSWIERQNSDGAQVYLAASDFYWGRVQTFRAIQFCIVLALPIGLAIAAQFFSNIIIVAAFFGFGMTLIDTALLYPYIGRERRQASQAQDSFDVIALSLRRSDIRAGEEQDRSDIQDAARRQDPRRTIRNKNWYTAELGALPLPLGRISCMRESTAWDGGLRDKYVVGLWVAVVLLNLGVIAYGVFSKQAADQILVRILFPLTPAIVWTGREIWDQSDSSRAVNDLRQSLLRTWNAALRDEVSADDLESRAEQYAFALFAYREKTAPVPHFLYSILRPNQTRSMSETARAAVDEFVQASKGADG